MFEGFVHLGCGTLAKIRQVEEQDGQDAAACSEIEEVTSCARNPSI
jgi:hypothetical protein